MQNSSFLQNRKKLISNKTTISIFTDRNEKLIKIEKIETANLQDKRFSDIKEYCRIDEDT